MHKSIVEKQLKKYMTYSVKNDEFTLDTNKMSELATEIVKLFAIPDVVGQSEQLICPRCNSTNCLLPDKENDAECNDCGFVWAG
jgi:hypothetical protein